jgi:hypothetical protein
MDIKKILSFRNECMNLIGKFFVIFFSIQYMMIAVKNDVLVRLKIVTEAIWELKHCF